MACCRRAVQEFLFREEEAEQRRYGCLWIQKAAILLRVPIEAAAHGQTIFHRFYFRRSMKEFDVKVTAAAALYLGCKLGETPRRIRDVVLVSHFIDWLDHKDAELETLHRRLKKEDVIQQTSEAITTLEMKLHLPTEESKSFRSLKMNIHRVERHILRETGFVIARSLVHPHRYILQYIHSLLGDVPTRYRDQVAQRAWGYLNDSLRTPLCCCVPPAVVTTASIWMAASDCGLELPQETRWFDIFDVTWEEIHSVADTLQQLYTFPTPVYRVLAIPPVPPPVSEVSSSSSARPSTRTVLESGDPQRPPHLDALSSEKTNKDSIPTRSTTSAYDSKHATHLTDDSTLCQARVELPPRVPQ